ncbi:hypothetical protein M9458_024228, partial [Cirrhinus mrigala]
AVRASLPALPRCPVNGSDVGNGDRPVPLFFLTHQIQCSPGRKHTLWFLPSTVHISSSEEVDVENYEELVEVVTHAVAKLKLDWPAEKPAELPRSKLDECFMRSKPPPPRQGLQFFPDLHTEVSRSWGKPFSARVHSSATLHYSIVVGANRGSQAICLPARHNPLKPRLCPLSRCIPRRRWWAKGTCQRTMVVFQAYQVDLLKELDEGEEIQWM